MENLPTPLQDLEREMTEKRTRRDAVGPLLRAGVTKGLHEVVLLQRAIKTPGREQTDDIFPFENPQDEPGNPIANVDRIIATLQKGEKVSPSDLTHAVVGLVDSGEYDEIVEDEEEIPEINRTLEGKTDASYIVAAYTQFGEGITDSAQIIFLPNRNMQISAELLLTEKFLHLSYGLQPKNSRHATEEDMIQKTMFTLRANTHTQIDSTDLIPWLRAVRGIVTQDDRDYLTHLRVRKPYIL